MKSKPSKMLLHLLYFSLSLGLASATQAEDSDIRYLNTALTPQHNAEAGQAEDIRYLNTSLISLHNGDVERALSELSKKDENDLCPKHKAEHLGVTCKVLLAKGDAAGASVACEQAIQLHSSRANWRHYNNLGIAYFQLGNDEAAIKALNEAVVRSGITVTPRTNLEAIQRIGTSGVSRVEVADILKTR